MYFLNVEVHFGNKCVQNLFEVLYFLTVNKIKSNEIKPGWGLTNRFTHVAELLFLEAIALLWKEGLLLWLYSETTPPQTSTLTSTFNHKHQEPDTFNHRNHRNQPKYTTIMQQVCLMVAGHLPITSPASSMSQSEQSIVVY